MSKILDKVFGRIFPKPEDGNACHEAAYDLDQMPRDMRKKLEQAQAKEAADKATANAPEKTKLRPGINRYLSL